MLYLLKIVFGLKVKMILCDNPSGFTSYNSNLFVGQRTKDQQQQSKINNIISNSKNIYNYHISYTKGDNYEDEMADSNADV